MNVPNYVIKGARRDAAVTFLRLAAAGKVRDAYARYVGPGFRHHNPYVRGDAASLATAMKANATENPHQTLEIRHAIEEGALVAVHSQVRLTPTGPATAVVHIFRFDGAKIVELWDIGQPVPDDSPNENGMF